MLYCIAMGAVAYGILTIIITFRESTDGSLYIGTVIILTIIFLVLKARFPQKAVNVAGILLMCSGFMRDLYLWIRLLMVNKTKNKKVYSRESTTKAKEQDDIDEVIRKYSYIKPIIKQNFNTISQLLGENDNREEYGDLEDEYNRLTGLVDDALKVSKLKFWKKNQQKILLRDCYKKMANLLATQTGIIDALELKRKKVNSTKKENNDSSLVYFADCDTEESLTKRYKNLCKVYHPDMGNGSDEIFKKIQEEYELVKSKI